MLKLHTGGGKTLVGLLAAFSSLNELNDPVLYLVPTKQLVNQTIDKATEIGIPVVAYENSKVLNSEFVNGKAIMIATYAALFNGKSKFGLLNSGNVQKVSTIILDDAHVAFTEVRKSFTLEIKNDDDNYNEITTMFRQSFKDIERIGEFDDIVTGNDNGVLEVPYWAWNDKLDTVRNFMSREYANEFSWTLLRNRLHLCHAIISKRGFTICPLLPMVDLFPTFTNSSRRIYMSATIADDSDIIRTFDVSEKAVKNALSSRSLAGISERMILIPEFMSFDLGGKVAYTDLFEKIKEYGYGSIVLVSSYKKGDEWKGVAEIARTSGDAEYYIKNLQRRNKLGPIVFSNRYDGLDLPGDSCRLLILDGLPYGLSDYEIHQASIFNEGSSITKYIAQRIEQGIGRGARGASDYCVVLLIGNDLSSWIAKKNNFNYLTTATKAQLNMGVEISKEVNSFEDLIELCKQCFDRDKEWQKYHAECLADETFQVSNDENLLKLACIERKAIGLWNDGLPQKAIEKIEQFCSDVDLDDQILGWINQLAARIACHWGIKKLSDGFQRTAYSLNKLLLRPKVLPPYTPSTIEFEQSKRIAEQVCKYNFRRAYITEFEEVCSRLSTSSSANQFEQALCKLGNMIGFKTERYDHNGVGPDVLWLLSNKEALIIEAKHLKKEKKPLTKTEHGQLLVAREWFKNNYPDYHGICVSIHHNNKAIKAASAQDSYALTLHELGKLIYDSKKLLLQICSSSLPDEEIESKCNELLVDSPIRHDAIMQYLRKFEVISDYE